VPASNSQLNVVVLKCPQCSADLPPSAGHVVCQYCGSSLVLRGARPQESPSDQAARGMRLKPFTMVDEQGTGMPVFTMLVPVGWDQRGGVTWNLGNVRMPATLSFQLWNKSGLEVFEIMPNMNFTTGGALGGLMSGGQSFGAPVRPPTDAQTALQELAIPRYRGGLEQMTVVRIESAPELAASVGAANPDHTGVRQLDGAKARITYTMGGHPLEEEIWAVVELWTVPAMGMFGGTEAFWFVSHILGFRAGEGQLEGATELFEIMVRSLKLNPAWTSAYEQTITGLAQGQIQHMGAIGQIGRDYAATGAQMRQENLQGWYGKHEVWDRLSRERSEAIRGVETYYDPYTGDPVELPAQYGHAWVSGQGEYLVTDDPMFDPNVDTDSTQNWEQMSAIE